MEDSGRLLTIHGYQWSAELVERIRAYDGDAPLTTWAKHFLNAPQPPVVQYLSWPCGCHIEPEEPAPVPFTAYVCRTHAGL